MIKNKSSSKLSTTSLRRIKKTEEEKCEENIEEEEDESKIIIQLFGQNPNLVQIIKGNGYYLLNRENFDVTKIMMLIDYQRLSRLGKAFRNYQSEDGEDGITKIDFVKILYNLLQDEVSEDEKTDFVYGIYKFFAEVDFNGDGHMEWAEFTQFIIDKVEGEPLNNIKEEDIKEKMTNKKIIANYKRYELSQKISDNTIHKTDIYTTSYLVKTNELLISEYNTSIIKIYNPLTGKVINNIDIKKINEKFENEKIEGLLKNNNQIINGKTLSNSKRNSNLYPTLSGKNYFRKKIKEKKSFTKNCSILYITCYSNIIAVLLSGKQIQFYTKSLVKSGELLYEINTVALQKRIWYLEDHNIWFSSGDRENGNDFYYINELDINFDFRSGFPVPISGNRGILRKFCKICQHKNEIYDVIETKRPFLVMTACLDKNIRLIDINNFNYIKIWKFHNLGVKHLDYNPNLENNGLIISTGFEYYINIYNTDLSIDDSYKGKLEGHFVPVIDCKFINFSQICLSVDEEGNIRIWDILLKSCLQHIPITKKNFSINGFLMMHKINKFILYGNIMLFYEAKYHSQELEQSDSKEEKINLIQVRFNKYYQNFYVVTNRDIRIYNRNGILEKTYRKCIENENFEWGVNIKTFQFEDNYRKFYLGFSNGAIMQYNAGNGSLIKKVNEYEINKDGIYYYKYHHVKEVSSLFYFHQKREKEKDNNLLISCGYDSTVQVYNDFGLESLTKLRTMKGAHKIGEKECEILCMDFSVNLCQLVTGGNNGLVTVWDFEFSKIQEILYFNHKIWEIKLDVLCVKYLDDYPLIFSSYSCGICALWGVYPLDNSIKLILKFHNFNSVGVNLDVSNVLCCQFYEGTIKDIEEKFIAKKFFVQTEEPKKQFKRKNSLSLEDINSARKYFEKESYVDDNLDPKIYDIEGSKDKEAVYGDNNQYLILGDQNGNLKLLNLTGIFMRYKASLCHKENFKVIGSNFNFLKKDDINLEGLLAHLIKDTYEDQKMHYERIWNDIYGNNIMKREWKGHSKDIIDMEIINIPINLVTLSKETLRIWNEKLELVGEIDIFPKDSGTEIIKNNIPWKFKIDEKKILENEINEIYDMFKAVGIRKTKFGSKKDKENEHLKFYKIEAKITKIEKAAETEGKPKKVDNKKESEIKKEEFDTRPGYDFIMLTKLTEGIERIFENQSSKEGFGHISNKLISSLIQEKKEVLEKRRKEKSAKKKSSLKNMSFNRLSKIEQIEKNNKFGSFIMNDDKTPEKKLKNSMKKKTGVKFKIGDTNTSVSKISSKFDNIAINSIEENQVINHEKKDYNVQSRYTTKNDNTLKEKIPKFHLKRNTTSSNFKLSKNFSTQNYHNKDSQLENKFKRPFSGKRINPRQISTIFEKKNISNYLSRPISSKKSINYVPRGFNRNKLFSSKIISKSNNSMHNKPFFPNFKEKLYEAKNLINRNLNYNIREKTEDVIKTQFYRSTFKKCCEILPNHTISTNTSIMLNYKDMWENVKNYSNFFMRKKERVGQNMKNLFRSKSSMSFIN